MYYLFYCILLSFFLGVTFELNAQETYHNVDESAKNNQAKGRLLNSVVEIYEFGSHYSGFITQNKSIFLEVNLKNDAYIFPTFRFATFRFMTYGSADTLIRVYDYNKTKNLGEPLAENDNIDESLRSYLELKHEGEEGKYLVEITRGSHNINGEFHFKVSKKK